MRTERLHLALTVAIVFVMMLAPASSWVQAQSPAPVVGRIAGVVVDRATGETVSGALVQAKLITENETFDSQRTDGLGGYVVSGVPAGIYAITIRHQGRSYRVADHFDVRMSMNFVLEACFALDARFDSAVVNAECVSGLYPERQVVSLGAHRYFRPESPETVVTGISASFQGLSLQHEAATCSAGGAHGVLRADIDPPEGVVSAKVFFRAPPDPNFYYIDMQDTGTGFEAVMPVPAPETSEFIYYIEVIDTSSERVQTDEFIVQVVTPCNDPKVVVYQGVDPGIVIGSSMPGVPVTPPGFLSGGTAAFVNSTGAVVPMAGGAAATSTGGGLGTRGLVIIVSAVAGTAVTLALVVPQQASPVN